jgi:hypothetical protein
MARDKLPDGKQADFGVEVEDEEGKPEARAALNFSAKTRDDIARGTGGRRRGAGGALHVRVVRGVNGFLSSMVQPFHFSLVG